MLPGQSGVQRRRQGAGWCAEVPGVSRPGFRPPPGRQQSGGIEFRTIVRPITRPSASNAMTMATAKPTPLVVLRLRPRGATAMAPTALSTVSHASIGAVRSSVRMVVRGPDQFRRLEQGDLRVNFRDPRGDVHPLLDKESLDPGDDLFRGNRHRAVLVNTDGASRLPVARLTSPWCATRFTWIQRSWNCGVATNLADGGMDERFSLLRNHRGQPGDAPRPRAAPFC